MHARLLFFLAISGLAASTGLSACSGTSHGGGPSSSSTSSPGGGFMGSSGGSSSSGSPGASSGAGNSSGSSHGGGDAGAAACMPLSTVPSSDLPPYATVRQQLNACSTMQISGFISACVAPSGGSQSACKTWAQANTKCASCIMPTNAAGMSLNTGAILFDANGNLVEYNFGGCIALVDPTSGGLACAQALDEDLRCADFACASCTDQTSTDSCQRTATNGGACSSYHDAYHTACKTDLRADGGGSTKCGTGSETINVICGTGM